MREILGGENKSSVGARSDQESMSPPGSNKFREALDFPPRVGYSQIAFPPLQETAWPQRTSELHSFHESQPQLFKESMFYKPHAAKVSYKSMVPCYHDLGKKRGVQMLWLKLGKNMDRAAGREID